MKIFKIALKGLIFVMFAALINIIYGLLAWFGLVETISNFMRYVASVVLIWIPCYILTSKVMKHVKID